MLQCSGDTIRLVIRQLRCKRCNRIHHELPNLLVPYKRYEAAGIEGAVGSPPAADVAVDESTLYRWRRWFALWAEYAKGCLESLACRFNLHVETSSRSSQSVLHPLGRWVGDAPGWLARSVRPITNANLWVHTRSAFLT